MAVKTICILLLVIHIVISDVCKRVPLSCWQIKHFVDSHNLNRQTVALGFTPNQPAAANMNYLVWDEELAEKAARWAENGLFSHNPNRTVPSSRWELVGENIYFSTMYSPFGSVTPNIDEAINSWFSEFANYGFEPYSIAIGPRVGHYTQMVWADTNKIGCGISQKKENGWVTTLFVCNYGPTGNWIGKIPYQTQSTQGHLQCVTGNKCKQPYGIYC